MAQPGFLRAETLACRGDTAAAGAMLAGERVHAGRHPVPVAVRRQRRPQVRAGPAPAVACRVVLMQQGFLQLPLAPTVA